MQRLPASNLCRNAPNERRFSDAPRPHDEQVLIRESEQAYQKAIELNPNAAYVWARLGDLLNERLARFDDAVVAYRRAVELEPTQEMAWIRLGAVLQQELGRQEQAEEALKKAVELNPDSAHLLLHLGQVLQANLSKRSDAEICFRKAIQIEPDYSGAWVMLGNSLSHDSARMKEAQDAYLKAIELQGPDCKAWLPLYRLRMLSQQEAAQTIEEVEEFLNRTGRSADDLNFMAWSIYSAGLKNYLAIAEGFARESMATSERTEENWPIVHTLASILGEEGKWAEALELAPSFLAPADAQERALGDSTEFILSAAAAGFAAEALEVVKNSAARKAFEPLEVGLRIYLGEEPQGAKEIVEVGRDVADRIRKKRSSRQEDSSSSDARRVVPSPIGP